MAVKIQIKRGSKAGLPALAPGEYGLATDTAELFVGGSSGNLQIPVLDSTGKVPSSQLPEMDYDPAGSAEAVQTSLTAHINDKTNPHGVTAAQVGAVPTSRTVNGKALSDDITLTAGDVGAGPGKRTARFTVGTSAAGWTSADCDYLCDGTADDVEINAAIQALPSTGGEIVILDGMYNITATIAMNKDDVKLSGNGNATVLKRMWNSSTNAGVITVTATNGGCCIENLCVDGNKATYDTNNNCGIYISGSNNNTITGNTCINNGQMGIYLYNSSDNTITDNTCNNNDNNGIYLYNICKNNTITGNTCDYNAKFGILVGGGHSNTITGNTCNRNTNHGINLGSGSNRNTITGNTYNYNTGSGIYLFGSDGNTITGNTCCNNTDHGIYLHGNNSNNTITGNTCNSNGDRGIHINCDRSTITGNTCNYNNSVGIYMYGGDDDTVTGNTCNYNNEGILLYSSNRNTITGNTCIRGTGQSSDYTSSQYTIRLNSTSNGYNLIAYNNIMGKDVVVGGGNSNTSVGNKIN